MELNKLELQKIEIALGELIENYKKHFPYGRSIQDYEIIKRKVHCMVLNMQYKNFPGEEDK